MTNFNLMILAAGYGKRMKNLTESTPKPLLKINNKALLSYNIDFFLNLGCKKIVINTHYLYEHINNFIKANYINVNIELIYEPFLLNTGGGIKNALSFFGNKNFLVTNTDVLWNKYNRKEILEFINNMEQVKKCKLLLVENDKFDGLKKTIGDFNLENNLIKRCANNDYCLYYTGLQIINPSIFSVIKKISFSMNLVWDLLIENKQLEGKIIKSTISHIGDIHSYNQIKNN